MDSLKTSKILMIFVSWTKKKKARKQIHYKLKSSLATKAHQSETENGCILQKNKWQEKHKNFHTYIEKSIN